MDSKPKAVIFYSYLPPWRIDVFNEMGKYYDLTIVFLNSDSEGFTYNKELLTSKLNVDYIFYDKGFKIKSKAFRFGIYKLLKKYNPEIVFSHEYTPTSILVSLFLKLRLFDFQYIITTSDNLKMAKAVSGLKKIARRIVLSSAKGIVVYSNIVKDWYKSNFNHLKVEVCPNIQNPTTLLSYKDGFQSITEKYKSQCNIKDSNIILYTGRLVEVKGLKLLLNAFARSTNDNYKLILVGEGQQKSELVQLAKSLGISEKVIFPGYFDGPNLYAWYSIANFFILPSTYEPFGAVVNEALIYGCPVVASKYIGALNFMKNDDNGLIFDPLNQQQFVSTLNNAMINYREYNSSRKNLMLYSFEEYVKNFKIISD